MKQRSLKTAVTAAAQAKLNTDDAKKASDLNACNTVVGSGTDDANATAADAFNVTA